MLTWELVDGVELRPLEPWQDEAFAAHVAAERAHLSPWLPWATTIVDAPTARELLATYADRSARDEGRLYGIWRGEAMAGGTLFRVWEKRTGVCEIGVWLAESEQGNGIVTRAVRRMIDYALRERGMHRVEWRCSPDNERSAAVAKRLGFTLDGVLREVFPVGGRRQDAQVWSLLAREWSGR
ncbi:RimJ/RimL family protein N-acetyltransferase [Herbihabitans rhizosphaerae]|uniref:RimJ/RimL family protein N-acetyltransferase n=1 Tax=Herbihabitans rhizosphaerae TaxID=1872711 RepID=A0A4Q7KCK6_9PSEU|nr:GNAT family protein [Herbihabitans rhizosphaerae]RZS29628.1 RimJ/RimL family protein N-acetyltransferase [Herbihabitans rhizosphaerae]